ncbi:sugar phosphate isomerase/epimerase family protein [Terriglobus saanensis]|uniref:Xylose isomerase domain-containing protein TIM barrel n=1 Tax=Terriglobus saanensis (strain ATCC BAA-1853 / DSM 23119 / SP1PR4) TaxID=401053 RepID=E8UXT3_TERSS|nr:sugar phosphate isomerase/epimerase [Terriglobus saanensis]ADV83099.1 Xylose isomerase domain-containing protein TIM barrel [Terriglobus saanensis SP1PR4]
MKVGISAFAWTSAFGASHLELLPMIRNLGLQGVEVPMFDPGVLQVDSIRGACERNGLMPTVCAILPKQYNPISPEREVRLSAIQHLKKCIGATAAMGAKLLGGPLFAPIGYLPEHRPTKDEWLWATEVFQTLGDDLNAYDLTLSIEPVNRSETFFLRTAEEASRLCELIGNPRIGVTIDTFHANIEERSIAEAIRSLGSHLKHIHASENDRGPLGRGHVPFVEIVNTLEELQFDGFVMIEGFGYSLQEKSAPGYLWAYPNVSPEAFVSESVQFLKGIAPKNHALG